jgi:hypothetical protein
VTFSGDDMNDCSRNSQPLNANCCV